MESSNAQLAAGVSRYGNAHLVDWYSLSAGHDEWFDGDGTHLNDEGSVAYMQMICDAMGYTAYTPSVNDFYTDNGQAHVGMEDFEGDTMETVEQDAAAAASAADSDAAATSADGSSATDDSAAADGTANAAAATM